jgi:hypothetical protein
MFDGARLCRKWVALEHTGVGGLAPQCRRWPNAGPMAQCGADGQWPRVASSRRHRARECPGRRLGAAGLGQSLLGPRWAARTLRRQVFEAQASAPKIPPRSTSARTNSYCTLSPSTRSRPSTRPPGPPAPRAPRRSGSCRLRNSRFSVETSRCMPGGHAEVFHL